MSASITGALPSPEDDAGAHRRLIYQLREAGGLRDRLLASRLESCAPGRRCRSGACLLCGRELQLALFEVIEREIREPARRTMRGRMTAVTIVPAEGILAPDQLTAGSCWRAMTATATALRSAGPEPLMAGFDISFNEDQEAQIAPHWSVHSHGATNDWLSGRQEEALRAMVTPCAWVRRRVRFDKLDDRANAPLYTIKPDRVRKVSYLDHSKATVGRASFRNTHRRELRPDQAVALAQVEHELGLANRFMIAGIALEAVRATLKGLYWPQDGP